MTVTSDSPTGVYNNFLDSKWKEKLFFDGHPESFNKQDFFSQMQNIESFYSRYSEVGAEDPYYYTAFITLSNSVSPIEIDIIFDIESVIEWADNFNSVSLSFDSPYNDGMIFNQD